MTKKWTCVNLNEKSVLNGPEVALCLLNQCKQWVPLCNMTHLFTLLSSWQPDQRFSIVLVTLYPPQLTSSVVSCAADGRASQCGWASDANCSANEFKHELRFTVKKNLQSNPAPASCRRPGCGKFNLKRSLRRTHHRNHTIPP